MLTYQTLSLSLIAGLSAVCIAVGAWLTGSFRKFAVAKRRLDIPNERSMHSAPVPRGGGIAIVIVFSLAVLSLSAIRGDMWLLAAAFVFPGGLVAAVGWLDDRSHVPAAVRAIVHIAACGIAVGLVIDSAWPLISNVPFLNLVASDSRFRPLTSSEYVSAAAAALGAAYLLNLYNFMDGLDGLAASEGAFAGLAGGALILMLEKRLWWMTGTLQSVGEASYHVQAAGVCAILLGASCFGFLVWNWPPAKIFMGDVGSGFLGFCFAVIIFTCAWIDLDLLWTWLILLAAFIADATYTLTVRVLTGQRWFEAHRLHAFQKLALRWKSHLKVTLAFWIVNVVWLLPLAYLSMWNRQWGPFLAAIAYVPLLVIASLVGAGLRDKPSVGATELGSGREPGATEA